MAHTLSEQEFLMLSKMSFEGRLNFFISKSVTNDSDEFSIMQNISQKTGISMKKLLAVKNGKTHFKRIYHKPVSIISRILNVPSICFSDNTYLSSYQDFMEEQEELFELGLPTFSPVQ